MKLFRFLYSKTIVVVAALLLLAAFGQPSPAQLSSQSGNWDDPNTWGGVFTPESTTTPEISRNHTVTITGGLAEAREVFVGALSGSGSVTGPGSLVQTGGELQASSMRLGFANGGDGAFLSTGGLVNVDRITIGAENTNGTFFLTGDSVLNAILVDVSSGAVGNNDNAVGTFFVAEDAIANVGNLVVGGRSSDGSLLNNSIGNLELDGQLRSTVVLLGNETSGLANITETAVVNIDHVLALGVGSDSRGDLNLTGGTVNINANANALFSGDFHVGSDGAGEVNLLESSILNVESNWILGVSAGQGTANVGGDSVVNVGGTTAIGAGGIFDPASTAEGEMFFKDNARLTTDALAIAAGDGGQGSLNLDSDQTQGVNVNVINDFNTGSGAESTSIVRVDGASSLIVGGDMTFGAGANFTESTLELGSSSNALENPNIRVDGNLRINAAGGENSQVNVFVDRGSLAAGNITLGNNGFNSNTSLELNDGEIQSNDVTMLGTAMATINNGSLEAAGDFNLSGNAEFSPTLNLNSGELNVKQNLNLKEGRFRQSGGLSNINTVNVGSELTDGLANFEVSGGELQTSEINFSGRSTATLSQGTIRAENAMFNGDSGSFNQEGGSFFVEDNARIGTESNDYNYQLEEGTIEIGGDLIVASGGVLDHFGGSLIVNRRFELEDEGEYQFTGGTLSSNGRLDFIGDFEFTDDAVLLLEGGGMFVDGTFDGEGSIDLSSLEIPQDELGAGFIPIIEVTDEIGFLDDIAVLNLLQGDFARVAEADFSIEGERVWAFARGNDFGLAGSIGIAFSGATAVPEPSTLALLPLILLSASGRRKRKV